MVMLGNYFSLLLLNLIAFIQILHSVASLKQSKESTFFFFSPAASGFVLATGSPFLLMLFPSTGSLGRVRILNATLNTEAVIVSSAVSKHDIALEVS